MSLFLCIFYLAWHILSLLINWGTRFLIPVDCINDFCQTLFMVPEFLSSRGGLDCFSPSNILPKPSKKTVTSPKSLKWMGRVNFDWPKVSKITIYWTAQSRQNNQFENFYISNHGEARNTKFERQVKLI